MTLQQAVELVSSVCANINTTLENHKQIQLALQTISQALLGKQPDAKPEKKKRTMGGA